MSSIKKKFSRVEEILRLLNSAPLTAYFQNPHSVSNIVHAAYDVRTPWESHAGNHIKRTLDRLRKRKLVKFKEKGDKVIIELTDLGKKEIIRFDINKMEIARSKKWDGRWWMVIFDIPEKYKKRRNIFQRKLKELGFYFIQKSVCLHPFSCKKETDFLREFYGIKKWVNLLRVDYFEEEYKAKLKFNLK